MKGKLRAPENLNAAVPLKFEPVTTSGVNSSLMLFAGWVELH
jgi:hypothetical protein